MGLLLAASRAIDALNRWIGHWLYWLILIMVLVSAVNAVVRKVFDTSSNSWLELQWYLFSAVFLIGAGYVTLRNEQIRIDIVNAQLDKRTRDWIDIIGHALFLLPLCLIMLYEAWPYVYESFRNMEQSSNAGGLLRWPVKALMLAGFALLLLQGLSELVKRIAVLTGRIEDPHEDRAVPH